MPKKINTQPSSTHRDVKSNSDVLDRPVDQTQNILVRLSQQFTLLSVLVVALFLFQAYTFYKLKQVEKTGVAGTGTTGATGQTAESPLSEKNLIAYAKDLKLDGKKFESCLKNEEGKSLIEGDMKQAGALKVQGTPGFFINGKFLGGAFPFEAFKEIIDKELDGSATGQCTDYSESIQQYCSDPNNQAFNPTVQDVALDGAPVKGKADAKVTIVEFSDFECPFCQRAAPTVNQILSTYKNDVRIAFKQLPLTQLHPNAMRAAQASVCAQKQGKFWEYHDKLFTTQGT